MEKNLEEVIMTRTWHLASSLDAHRWGQGLRHLSSPAPNSGSPPHVIVYDLFNSSRAPVNPVVPRILPKDLKSLSFVFAFGFQNPFPVLKQKKATRKGQNQQKMRIAEGHCARGMGACTTGWGSWCLCSLLLVGSCVCDIRIFGSMKLTVST